MSGLPQPAPQNPIAAGVALALLAALAFGATVPFIGLAGASVGPFVTAALLYAGAFLGALPRPGARAGSAPPLTRAHLPRLLAVAGLGAALAPVLLAWGLQRVSAVHGSLLLNFEAVFTVLFASLLQREPLGGRVAAAALLMLAAGALSVTGGGAEAPVHLPGALAMVGAVAAWALDNVLTRPLSELSPTAVVRAKAALGAGLTGTLAVLYRESLPAWPHLAALLLCGLGGYGLSLRLYLLAQRRIGAGRTGSVFAVAPFAGAALALLLEGRLPGWPSLGAAALFAAGVLLHLTERHGHEHVHEALEHEHVHRHGEGHHEHRHEDGFTGEHSHPHRHDAATHSHPHGPDLHHLHAHDEGKRP